MFAERIKDKGEIEKEADLGPQRESKTPCPPSACKSL
jgi:hypothetical protein